MASGNKDEDGPLDAATKERLRNNLDYLVNNIDTEPILQPLCQSTVISPETKDEIMAETTPARRAAVLIDVIMRRSSLMFKRFLEILEKSNQLEVFKIIMGPPKHGGAVAKITSRLLETVKRHEDILISNIRFEGSFLLKLCSSNVVTERQKHALNAIPNRIEKAEMLLAYIKRGAGDIKLESFAAVLGETDQCHLRNLILHEDLSGVFSDEDRRAYHTQLAECVDSALKTGLIYNVRKLEEIGTVTASQREEIQQEKNKRGRAELLLDIMQCRPISALHSLHRSIEAGEFTIKDPPQSACSVSYPMPLPFLEPGLGKRAHLDSDGDDEVETSDTVKEANLINKYQHKLKVFMQTEPLKSNRKLQNEFGLEVGTAVFFISLLIVPRDVKGHPVEHERQLYEQRHDTYIEVPHIFDRDTRGKYPRRVLVLGAAGSGKTTLVQHSCEQWAAGNLWPNFRYVFLLTCRRLNRAISQNTKISMFELLLDQGPHVDKQEMKNVMRELLENQEHTLVIIDGIDELSKWNDFMREDLRQIQHIEEPAEIIEIFHSILGGHLMEKANFIVTSRPIDRIDYNQFERGVRISGFGKDAIEKCILELSSGDTDKCRRIQEYLDQRPQLKMLCTLPLGCIMTGKVVFDELSDTSERKEPHETINCATLLIIRVLFVLLHRRCSQITSRDRFDLIRQLRDTLSKFMRLAAFGLLSISPQLIFDTNALQDHDIETDDLRYGFLDIESDQKDFSALPQDVTCSFIHLSIQEFFTALHIAVTWKKIDVNMITSRVSPDQFSMILLYLSGLLGNPLGHRLIRAMDDTIGSSKLSKRLTKLFDKLVVEYEGRLRFLPTLTKKGKEGTKLGRLQLIKCVAEGNNKALVQKIDRLVLKAGTLDLKDMPGGILPEHTPAISFYLQSTQAIKSLVLEKHSCVKLMRMITAENQARLVPLLDGCLLERPPAGGAEASGVLNITEGGDASCVLNLSGEKLTEEDFRGVSQYIELSTAIRGMRLKKMYCINMMRIITPENKARLVSLLNGSCLYSGILSLRGVQLSKEDLAGLLIYTTNNESLRTISMDPPTTVLLIRMITPENQASVVHLLDQYVLERGVDGDREYGEVLNLSGGRLSDEDLRSVLQYIVLSTAISELRLERYYCVHLMRMITPENQARLIPLLDGCVLEGGQAGGEERSGILNMTGENLTEEDFRSVVQYIVHSTAIRKLRLDKSCFGLMNLITPDNQARLTLLLHDYELRRWNDGGRQGDQGLDLDGEELTDYHVRGLCTYITHSVPIEYLSLWDCGISDQGTASLAHALEVNSSLEVLCLSENKVSDSGAAALASSLKTNKTLQTLILNSNMISDSGATTLASALEQNTTLIDLNLWGNKLSDVRKRELKQLLGDRVYV